MNFNFDTGTITPLTFAHKTKGSTNSQKKKKLTLKNHSCVLGQFDYVSIRNI